MSMGLPTSVAQKHQDYVIFPQSGVHTVISLLTVSDKVSPNANLQALSQSDLLLLFSYTNLRKERNNK